MVISIGWTRTTDGRPAEQNATETDQNDTIAVFSEFSVAKTSPDHKQYEETSNNNKNDNNGVHGLNKIIIIPNLT